MDVLMHNWAINQYMLSNNDSYVPMILYGTTKSDTYVINQSLLLPKT